MDNTQRGAVKSHRAPLLCALFCECVCEFLCSACLAVEVAASAYLQFFLHVYLFAVGLYEAILEERELLVRNDAQSTTIMHLPPAFQAPKAFSDEGINEGVKMQRETAYAECGHYLFDLTFQCVRKEERTLNGAGSVACGTTFLHLDFHSGPHALTRDLHKPEL